MQLRQLPLLLVLASTSVALAAEPSGVRADFIAEVRLGSDSPVLMQYSGKVAWSDPQLRLDLLDAMTQEASVLLVNFDTAQGVVLYPDTLNGYKADLKQLDQSGHLARLREMLQGKKPAVPSGWTAKELGQVTLNKIKCSHMRYSKPDGSTVETWTNNKRYPVRIRLSKQDVSITLDAANIKDQQTIPATEFSYGKEFKLAPLGDTELPGLTSL
jgi:hypothetical protein